MLCADRAATSIPATVRRLDETLGVVLDMLGYERMHEATLVWLAIR